MLKNKTALITGANRGIGFSVLTKYAQEGANIIAHSRTASDSFIKQCSEISEKYNVSILHIHFDLLDKDQIKKEKRCARRGSLGPSQCSSRSGW